MKQSPIVTEIAVANFLIALSIRLTLGTVKQFPIITEIAMANFLIALLIRR